jgi:hypothetical protein
MIAHDDPRIDLLAQGLCRLKGEDPEEIIMAGWHADEIVPPEISFDSLCSHSRWRTYRRRAYELLVEQEALRGIG